MTDQTQPAEQAGGDDVRADVMAAFDKFEPETPETEQVEAAEETKSDRPRDESGRFAKTEDPKEETVETELSDQDKLEEQPEQPSTAAGAPVSWSGDAKTEWSKLPPAVQEAVVKREREIDEGGRRWSEEKRRFEESLAPVRALAERHGVDEATGIQKLAAAQEYLDRDPAGALQWLAQSYGVDLKQLADAPTQAQPRVDPVINTLAGEVSQLKQYITSREEQEIRSEIDSFSTDRPHFDEVRHYMGNLLESGAAESMQDAYDQACWALPAVREKLLADQKAEAERKAKEREQVTRARRGAVSLSGSPSSPPASQPKEFENIRDAVLDAWDQHATG